MTESEWLTCEDAREMLTALMACPGGTPLIDCPAPSNRKLRLFACACCRSWEPGAAQHPKGKTAINEMLSIGDDLADGVPVTIDRIGTVIGLDGSRISTGLLSLVKEPAIVAAQEHCNQRRKLTVVRLMREIVGNPFRAVTLPTKQCWDCRGYGNHLGAGPDRGNPECDTCKGTGRLTDCPWLTPDVLSLALAAYEERLPDGMLDQFRLGLVADALEEAGCPESLTTEVPVTLLVWRNSRGWCVGPIGSGALPTEDFDSPKEAMAWAQRTFGVKAWASLSGMWRGDGVVRESTPYPLPAHLRSPGPHYRGMWSLDLVLGKE